MSRSVMLEALPPPFPKGIEVNDPNDASLRVMAGEADCLVTGTTTQGCCNTASLAERALSPRPPSAPRRFDALQKASCGRKLDKPANDRSFRGRMCHIPPGADHMGPERARISRHITDD